MKKYWQIFKVNLETFMEYRADLAISFLLKISVFFAFYIVWKQIADEGNEIHKYGLSGIVFYYLAAQVLDGLIPSQTAKDLRNSILTGYLSTKIVKPFNILIYYLFKNLSRIVSELFMNIVLVIPVFLLFPTLLQHLNISFLVIFEFLIVTILASNFNFLVYLLVGFAAFWTKQAGGLQSVVKNGIKFFTGDYLPLDLLPFNFYNILTKLPFAYTLYFPIKILMGEVDPKECIIGCGIILFWIVVFTMLNLFAWRKGLKRYESVGI